MALSSYQRSMLEVIYEAHKLLCMVPADRWNDDAFYDHASKTSNLFGHYVRILNQDLNPLKIHFREFMLKAAPLSQAINEVLSMVLSSSADKWDSYSISSGMHPSFPQQRAYDRAMAFFELVEKKFPPAVYHQQQKTMPQ